MNLGMSNLENKNKTSEPRSRGKGALRVYNKLREDILRMELEPGELLDEVEIGKQFNLSRSPVREALIRLSAEGLVKTLPNKSTLVAPLNIAEFSQFVDALDLIQRATSRLAAKLRSDEDLQNIKDQQAKFDEAVASPRRAGDDRSQPQFSCRHQRGRQQFVLYAVLCPASR